MILQKPAFYAHVLSGLCLVLAAYLLLSHLPLLRRLSPVQAGLLALLTSIALAHHAQSHVALEQAYGYDPLSSIG